jgi:hypothetical protein
MEDAAEGGGPRGFGRRRELREGEKRAAQAGCHV